VGRAAEKKALRTTDEGVASFVKAKHLIRGARNADADSFSDGPGRMTSFAKPEGTASAEVETVVAAVDSKGSSEASGAASEIEKPRGFAMALHERDAIEGFDRPDENRRGYSCGLAHNVQHEVRAVIEKNVRVAWPEIHRANARRRAAEMMSRGIAGRIGFRFHDAAAQAARRKIVNDDFSNEEAGELDGVRRKLGAAEAANGKPPWMAF